MASRSLRHVIRKPMSRNDVLDTFTEYQKLDDRSAVIFAAAVIEVGLERLIRARMRKLGSDDYNALFSGTGPLASFSAKTRIAYALEFIGPATRHDLAIINEIRNVFAHAPRKITLKNKSVWDRLLCLKIVSASRKAQMQYPLPGKSTRKREMVLALAGYACMLGYKRHPRIKSKQYRGDNLFQWRGTLHL